MSANSRTKINVPGGGYNAVPTNDTEQTECCGIENIEFLSKSDQYNIKKYLDTIHETSSQPLTLAGK